MLILGQPILATLTGIAGVKVASVTHPWIGAVVTIGIGIVAFWGTEFAQDKIYDHYGIN